MLQPTHIDVLLYQYVSADKNPYNIPSDWPYETIEVYNENQPIPFNYIRMSKNDYNTYITDSTRVANYQNIMAYVNTMTGIESNINKIVNLAAEFGRQIMLEYGTRNVMAGKSPEQVAAIMIKMAKVQQLVLGGALYTALSELDNVEVDGVLIDNTNMNFFKNKLRVYLGLPTI
jgi:hypothetical protein